MSKKVDLRTKGALLRSIESHFLEKGSHFRAQRDDLSVKRCLFRDIDDGFPSNTDRQVSMACRKRLQAAQNQAKGVRFRSIEASRVAMAVA